MNVLLKEYKERYHSSLTASIFHIGILGLCFCMLCHVVTCSWYALGSSSSGSWVTFDEHTQQEAIDQQAFLGGFPYWYVTSGRWVVSQVNGRTDMDARLNMNERAFVILAAVLLGLMGTSVLASLITKALLDLSDKFKAKADRKILIDKYLRSLSIPFVIERFVRQTVDTYEDIELEKDREEEILSFLPEILQPKLIYEVRKSMMKSHPLFLMIMTDFREVGTELCARTLKHVHVLGDDKIFNQGDACTRMLLVHTGSLRYKAIGGKGKLVRCKDVNTKAFRMTLALRRLPSVALTYRQSRYETDEGTLIAPYSPTNWISEAALWVVWSNKGKLHTEKLSSMVEVDALELACTLACNPIAHAKVASYGKSFVETLKASKLNNSLSDVMPCSQVPTSSIDHPLF